MENIIYQFLPYLHTALNLKNNYFDLNIEFFCNLEI